MLLLADKSGNALASSSSGALGFKGAKGVLRSRQPRSANFWQKKAQGIGIKEVDVIVKGVGAGRESSLRAFSSKGIAISGIKDRTPVPHNGPKPKKPRRV